MVKIAPSLLSADFGRLREEIAEVSAAGADLLHLDVMDGHFVPNLTFGPFIVEAIRKLTPLPLDCHLMIEDPLTYGPQFAKAGADIVTFHVEVKGDPKRTFDAIEAAGARAGMVVNPGTDPRLLRPWLPRCAMVLVMSVRPGFGGQKFIPRALAKVRAVSELVARTGSSAEIEVDGGVGPDNIRELVVAGARWLVAGSSVFSGGDAAAAVRALRRRASGRPPA